MKCIEPFDRAHRVYPERLEIPLEGFGQRRRLRACSDGRRLDQEVPVSLVTREEPDELFLAHDQLPLQHAVAERSDESQRQRTGGADIDRHRIPQRGMEDVLQRGGIGDDRHRSVVERPLQQQPGVRALLICPGKGSAEREPSTFNEGPLRRDDSWIGRAVKVEAAGILPRTKPEPAESYRLELRRLDQQGFSPGRLVRVVHDGDISFGQKRVTASPRLRIPGKVSLAAPERVHRDDDEGS